MGSYVELLTILATIAGLFIWNRSESREDCRRTDALIAAIREDIKDFHGRLCSLETKKKVKEG